MAANDFEILDERFKRCIRTSANIERLFTGCRWTEGPVYVPADALTCIQRHSKRPHAAFR